MQRPWGRAMLEEQPGGPCGRNRVSGGENRRGGERGDGTGCAEPVSHKEDSGFYPKGGESPGGLWAEEGQSSCNF